MRRRDFISFLVGAAATWPPAIISGPNRDPNDKAESYLVRWDDENAFPREVWADEDDIQPR